MQTPKPFEIVHAQNEEGRCNCYIVVGVAATMQTGYKLAIHLIRASELGDAWLTWTDYPLDDTWWHLAKHCPDDATT